MMKVNLKQVSDKEVSSDAIRLIHKGEPVVYREWQKKVQAGRKRFTVIAVHRRAGKSVYACCELLSAALNKRGNYAYVSPLKRQSKENVWNIMKELLSQLTDHNKFFKRTGFSNEALVKVRSAEGIIELFNGSHIYLYGTEDPESLRGNEFTGLIMDEVAQMPRDVWFSVLRPTLFNTGGWVIFIGTPHGIDLFSELFAFGQDPSKKNWTSFKFTYKDTQALDEEEVAEYAQMGGGYDSNYFKREMLCDFTASSSDQLLCLDDVTKAAQRRVVESDDQLVMGVDVAGFGDDRTVFCLRKGYEIVKFYAFHELTLSEIASKINDVIFEYPMLAAIMVDATGYGYGLLDLLYRNRISVPIYDINFSSSASSPNYFNRRAEMWFRMADWIKNIGKIPNDFTLFNELCAPTFSHNESGKLQLEKKADIKKRLGYSPDLADAIALTFAENLSFNSSFDRGQIRFVSTNNTTSFDRFNSAIKNRQGGNKGLWDRLL